MWTGSNEDKDPLNRLLEYLKEYHIEGIYNPGAYADADRGLSNPLSFDPSRKRLVGFNGNAELGIPVTAPPSEYTNAFLSTDDISMVGSTLSNLISLVLIRIRLYMGSIEGQDTSPGREIDRNSTIFELCQRLTNDPYNSDIVSVPNNYDDPDGPATPTRIPMPLEFVRNIDVAGQYSAGGIQVRWIFADSSIPDSLKYRLVDVEVPVIVDDIFGSVMTLILTDFFHI